MGETGLDCLVRAAWYLAILSFKEEVLSRTWEISKLFWEESLLGLLSGEPPKIEIAQDYCWKKKISNAVVHLQMRTQVHNILGIIRQPYPVPIFDQWCCKDWSRQIFEKAVFAKVVTSGHCYRCDLSAPVTHAKAAISRAKPLRHHSRLGREPC